MTTPHANLRHLIDGYRVSQMICVAAELGIADLLEAGPMPSTEIAGATNTHAPTLYRLLRALAGTGILTQVDGNRFALTALGDCLRAGASGSLRPWAIHSGRLLYDTWTHLDHSVATGDTAFDYSNGMGVWEYRERHPEQGQVFHEAMATTTQLVSRSVTDAYDFSKFQTLVDVGGGKGALIQSILDTNPELRGILFDVKAALQDTPALFKKAELIERCRFETGNFFEFVPAGGDAYVLSRILHDWDNDQCAQILARIRQAMTVGSTLLIIERTIDEENPGIEATQSDINMLVMTGGRERTEEEFRTLLATSRFKLVRVIPTDSPMKIIEAVPI